MLIDIRYGATREINANGKKLKFLTFGYKIVIALTNVNFHVH